MYRINFGNILFSLDDNIGLNLWCRNTNNIIDESSFHENYNKNCYNQLKLNNDNINKIYEQIIDYYNFENKIKNSLYTKKKESYLGNFIDKKWIQKWMEYSHYHEYYKILEKQNHPYEKIIKNSITYYEEIEKGQTKKLEKLKIYDFKLSNEFKKYIENNSFILVDNSFLRNFMDNAPSFSFYTYDNIIELIKGGNYLKINAEKVINSLKPSSSNANMQPTTYSYHLKILFKLFYFKEELINKIYSKFIEHSEDNKKELYLLNKEFIKKYEDFYDYISLYNYLKTTEALSIINYKNLKSHYTMIFQYLEMAKKDYLKYIQNLEATKKSFEFSKNDCVSKFKIFNKFNEESKNIKYITDYEIIDEDIISSFERMGISIKKYIVKCSLIASDNYIFISFIENNKYFFQIDTFDKNEQRFINEFVIEDNLRWNDNIINYFNQNGVGYFITRRKNNKLYYHSNSEVEFCNCYYVKNLETSFGLEEPQDSNISMNNKNIQKIMEIIRILLSYSLLDNKIRDKITESQKLDPLNNTRTQIENYYLINKEIFSEFLNLFWSDIIKLIMTKYKIKSYNDIDTFLKNILQDIEFEEYINFLSNKIDNFTPKYNCNDLLKIEPSPINNGNDILYYPKDLMFVSSELYSFLIKFMSNQNNQVKDHIKIRLSFNYGNIVFKGESYNFLENQLHLIFIYSMDTILNGMNYNLEAILSFKYLNDNNFSEILNKNIFLNCKTHLKEFENEFILFSLKIFLNKDNKNNKDNISNITPGLNNELLNDSENQKSLDNNLLNLVKIYDEILNLTKKICEPTSEFPYQDSEKYYLINNKYINDLKEILHFKKIENVLTTSMKDFYININYNPQDFLNKLKSSLSDSIKKELIDIEKITGFSKFNDLKPYELQKTFYEKNKNLYYYQNSIIINEKIYNLLCKFTPLAFNIFKLIDCIFIRNHIIIKMNNLLIVGHLEGNNQFITDYLIHSEFSLALDQMLSDIRRKGYNYLKECLNRRYIKIYYNGFNLEASIYHIYQNGNINTIENSSFVSEKLKAIILLYLESQKNDRTHLNNSDKLGEEVYLINEEILSNPVFKEVESMMNSDNEMKDLILKFNIPKSYTDLNQLDELISKLDDKKMKILDSKISSSKFQLSPPNFQTIKLEHNKIISIYRKFIMLEKHIFQIICHKLEMREYSNIPNLFYKKKEGDFIIDKMNSIIYYGKIKDDNYYEVNYILTITGDLQNELQDLIKFGLDKYLEIKAVFNIENQYDIISPLFNGKYIEGHCYHIIHGKNDYTNYNDYSKYLGNEILQKVWNLYNYYKEFQTKMNQDYYYFSDEKKYYLIRKDIMSHIKKEYYYQEIIKLIEQANQNDIKENTYKILLYVLKFLPENILEDIIKNEKNKKLIPLDSMVPDIQPINENNSNKGKQLAIIYNDFEIISPDVAKNFIEDIKQTDYFLFENYNQTQNLMTCILKDRKILIKYPNNFSENKKDVLVIGTTDHDNNFLNEYVFIFEYSCKEYIEKLVKRDLNKYLRNLQPYNNMCPIVINEFEIIGNIIFITKNNQDIDINFDNQIDIDEEKPKISIPQGGTKNSDLTFENKGYNFINNNDNNSNDNDTFIDETDEKEYNLLSTSNYTSIVQSFAFPPLIGLDNIGATCYMNATLQCLCNIEKFVSHFKYNRYLINIVSQDKGKKKLCSSFKLLIEKLWPDNYDPNAINKKNQIYKSHRFYSNQYENIFEIQKKNDSFPPDNFKKKISWMNSLFKGVAANDAKDLVQFLIMKLHTELNRVKGNNNINNIPVQNQTNKQLMFQAFASDFVANNASLISDLFYAVNYSITECGYCHSQSFNYQTYFFLVFPLEEVRIFKSQNTMNFNYNNFFNNNEVNIYDCFFYDQKITYMAGNNAMYCNYCKQTCNNSMRTILATGPEILIIILNRGKGTEFKVKINFLEQIDLTSFIEMNQTGCKYNLIGVITHIGESGMGGHIIAYCRNPISKDWHKYNDSIVTPVTDFKKDVIDFTMPYLLFYQKIS
jgi:ubiquitin C-terminal hydrolase